MTRLLVVLAVLALFAAVRPLLARSRRRAERRPVPDLTLERFAVTGADRTWLVFTTPYCATCGPLVEELRARRPADAVVEVDATVEHELSARLGVRRSPTVFVLDGDGHVEDRHVGAEATRASLAGLAVTPS
ncbi:MAG: thioredoxin family protein [Actinomycetota bacterium]